MEKAGSPVTFFFTFRKGGRESTNSSSLEVVKVCSKMRFLHLEWQGAW